MSFKCDKCGKSFVKSSSLSCHRKISNPAGNEIVQFMLEYLEKKMDGAIHAWSAEDITEAKRKFQTDTIEFPNTSGRTSCKQKGLTYEVKRNAHVMPFINLHP